MYLDLNIIIVVKCFVLNMHRTKFFTILESADRLKTLSTTWE